MESQKIMEGNGTAADVAGIQRLGQLVMSASRCGLGQTSPHPLLTTIANFPDAYAARVRKDVDYTSRFDLASAIADSSAAAHRSAAAVSPVDAAGEE
jgi:[NiFe] hydrogenase diaphorase moiety large subunit